MSYTDELNGMYGECGGMRAGMRSFLTKEEKLEILKSYKEELEKEVQGVSERIKQLEKNN